GLALATFVAVAIFPSSISSRRSRVTGAKAALSVHLRVRVRGERRLVRLPFRVLLELRLGGGDLLWIGEHVHHRGAEHLGGNRHPAQADGVNGARRLSPAVRR